MEKLLKIKKTEGDLWWANLNEKGRVNCALCQLF